MKPISSLKRNIWVIAGLMLASPIGCGHTTKVEDSPADRRKEDSDKDKSRRDDKEKADAAKPKRAPAAASGDQGSDEHDTVPVAASPTQMLAEGAVKDVQRKLQDKGLLGSGQDNVTGKWDAKTEASVRKFQEQNGLPGTGFPDRATAKALGLDADELFKREQQEGAKKEERAADDKAGNRDDAADKGDDKPEKKPKSKKRSPDPR